MKLNISSVQFSYSVMSDSLRPRESQHAKPVHHQLPEFTQTHVHLVGNAIQPSHPLSSPSPPALNPSQHQGFFPVSQLFAWGSQSTGVSASASVLPMNTQGWSPSEWTGWISLQSRSSSKLSSVLDNHLTFTITKLHFSFPFEPLHSRYPNAD